MSEEVFSVAVRHKDGSKNLYHMSNPDNLSTRGLMAIVRNELPESKVILCAVKPLTVHLQQVR